MSAPCRGMREAWEGTLTPTPRAPQVQAVGPKDRPPRHRRFFLRPDPRGFFHSPSGPRHRRREPLCPRAEETATDFEVRHLSLPFFAPTQVHYSITGSRYRSRITELRKEHAEFIETKRQEAADASSLLEEHVRRKMAAETASNGAPETRVPFLPRRL